MRQLTPTIEVETRSRGANHGIVTTSAGLVMIDSPYRPSAAIRLRDELVERGAPLRYLINTEPHVDHWTGDGFFETTVIAHDGVRERIAAFPEAEHRARIATLGPGEDALFEGYRRNLPAITLGDRLGLRVGDHHLRLIHMPGHTPFQVAVVVEEAGVAFTSDNLFVGVMPWMQEAEPDAWFRALDDLRALPVDTYVPGHGEVADREAIDVLEAALREWIEYVGREGVAAGMAKETAVEVLTALDHRWPMGPEQAGLEVRVRKMNVANLYDWHLRAGIHAGRP